GRRPSDRASRRMAQDEQRRLGQDPTEAPPVRSLSPLLPVVVGDFFHEREVPSGLRRPGSQRRQRAAVAAGHVAVTQRERLAVVAPRPVWPSKERTGERTTRVPTWWATTATASRYPH